MRQEIVIILIISLLFISGVSSCEQPKGFEDAFNPSNFNEISKIEPPAYGESPFGIINPPTNYG